MWGRGGDDFRPGGGGGDWKVDNDANPKLFFTEPEPASWTQVTDMEMIMRGELRADGGVPPWVSVKERAMPSPCPESIYIFKKGRKKYDVLLLSRPDDVREERAVGDAQVREW